MVPPVMFDPDSPELWLNGSDVNWIKGGYANSMQSPGVFARDQQWFVANRLFAETMVRNNPQAVMNIIGALFSWRVCTTGQLADGLAAGPVPEFDRDEQNLYGALCRIGAISVGFDTREYFEHARRPDTWLTIGNDSSLVRDAINLIDRSQMTKQLLSGGTLLRSMRVHARHNTYASHVGVSLVHDDRVRFAGGDGWGAFRRIDANAVAKVGLNKVSSTDVVTLLSNNVMAGIELQTSTHTIQPKIQNWAKLLAYSPMSRRGLMCIWLFVRRATNQGYSQFKPLFEHAREMTEMTVGDPSVAQRMGYATWDEWFDHGEPTGLFGTYTDMMGVRRSMFDERWRGITPTPLPLESVDEWGWRLMRDGIYRNFGWDASSWSMPDKYRGGFFGFAKGGADGVA